jgi:hypothetical protein
MRFHALYFESAGRNGSQYSDCADQKHDEWFTTGRDKSRVVSPMGHICMRFRAHTTDLYLKITNGRMDLCPQSEFKDPLLSCRLAYSSFQSFAVAHNRFSFARHTKSI